MSVKDLTTRWEEALARAISQQDRRDTLQMRDLEAASGMAVRSNVRAAEGSTWLPWCGTVSYIPC